MFEHANRIRFATYALAVIALAYGVYLLFVGVAMAVWVETPEGGEEIGRQFLRTSLGLVPLVGGAIVLVGLLARKEAIIWLGWLVIAGFAVSGIFGSGGLLQPVALVLLMLILKEYHPAGIGDRD